MRDAALQFGAPLSLLAAVGTFLGGYITERATERFPTAMARVLIGIALAVPAYAAAFFEDLDTVFVLGVSVLSSTTATSARSTTSVRASSAIAHVQPPSPCC